MASIDKTTKLDSEVKSSNSSCNLCGKTIAKVLSSIIVPLLIGAATVLISIVQLQIASKQRSQDLQIATERREQDLHVADNLQKELVLAAYIEQMSELMLTPNFTIDNPIVANMCRAKTLLAIRQLDSKRKTHLIKFLYEAGMIYQHQPHIDLADAELDNIDLSDTYHIENIYRSNLIQLFFQRTSLNYASFAHQGIINGTFERASLIGANFTGCRFSSTSFVGATLRYANFHNAACKEYLNFKSADLFGANIPDELLLHAISIDGAILPNGTRSTQPNLLTHGDAEISDCRTNTSIPSSWYVEQISGDVTLSVMSNATSTNVIHLKNSTISTDQCFYAARGQEGTIVMRQEIFSSALSHMPISHGNVMFISRLFCAPVGSVDEEKNFVEVRVEQLNSDEMSLHNYTKKIIKQGSYTRFIDCHKQFHRLVFTLSFTRLSTLSKRNDKDSDIFFYCDNIYLSMIPDSRDQAINDAD